MSEAEAVRETGCCLEDIVENCGATLDLSNLLKEKRSCQPCVCEAVAERVSRLDVGDNLLNDIPASLFKLRNLVQAEISRNRLAEIPCEIVFWSKIEVLKANGNLIVTLPEEIEHLTKLKVLQLDFNYLTSIPTILSDLPQLEVLSVMSNPGITSLPSKEFFEKFPSLTIYLDNSENLKAGWRKMSKELPNINVVWNNIWPNEVVENVFLGSLRSAQNPEIYRTKGITHVLTCGKNLDVQIPDGVEQLCVEVGDTEEDNIQKYFDSTLAFIVKVLTTGGRVLVHCFAGVSRSATVCTAFLIGTKNTSSSEALSMVKAAHPPANPNPGFVRQLGAYAVRKMEVAAVRTPAPPSLKLPSIERLPVTRRRWVKARKTGRRRSPRINV
eukprot:TRINITY_DN24074_c0_g1_i1.p1 TRINITY_DN24074_c0_g1~~TRINITY_DN24074_c0_g1_i1.p1  ORF type:complete len:408 (+),score=25.43 TRINITY_DN24074_c0_g1_i1:73-1224(+)